MEDQKFFLCINREYGSGGRTVGKMLAEELGIHFYDQQILKITSETSAVGEQFFSLADEKAGNNLLYKIFDSLKPSLAEPELGGKITKPDNLFRFQAKMIRELAAREKCCIFAGRCADYLLQKTGVNNVISMFLYADLPTKIERMIVLDHLDAAAAEKKIRQTDKDRKEYYKYYTGRDWDDCYHYDLCIDTSKLTFPQAAEIIKNYLRVKGYDLEGLKTPEE